MNITQQIAICPHPQVIDLARPHPEGGYDPEDPISITPLAPGVDHIRTPRQPVRIGHVAGSVRDPDSPIYTNGEVTQPGDLTFIDAGCDDCDSGLVVLPNQEPGVTWLVIEHSATCPALAAWTRRSA